MLICDLVEELVREHGTRDPFKLCSHMGIIVQRHTLAGCRGYYRKSNGYDVITLSEQLSDEAATYVCAHELGHYLLHQRLNRIMMDLCTFMEPGRFENEADKIAAQLVFGEPPLFQDKTFTSWELAEILNVHACNVDSRMVELGIFY